MQNLTPMKFNYRSKFEVYNLISMPRARNSNCKIWNCINYKFLNVDSWSCKKHLLQGNSNSRTKFLS